MPVSLEIRVSRSHLSGLSVPTMPWTAWATPLGAAVVFTLLGRIRQVFGFQRGAFVLDDFPDGIFQGFQVGVGVAVGWHE